MTEQEAIDYFKNATIDTKIGIYKAEAEIQLNTRKKLLDELKAGGKYDY